MIAEVRLRQSGILTSRLGFGTSRLHYLAANAGQNLLAQAADLGFRHFDTAPAYGDGLAERELGRFAKKRPDLVIVSKYGIPEDPILAVLPALGFPLRVTRALARRAGLWRATLPPLTPEALRASAEKSLRRLKRDRIDILLLHEPSLSRVSDPNAITEEFQRLKARGLIRAFGLAGGWNNIAALIAKTPSLGEVVQTSENEWPAGAAPDITYGGISGGAQSFFAGGIASEEATERLKAALSRRAQGVVLISTREPAHLQALAACGAAG